MLVEMFQMMQLTSVTIKGPSTWLKRFIVSLSRAAISHQEWETSISYSPDFARNAQFTQKDFFWYSVVSMLNALIALAKSFCFEPR